MMDIGTYFSSSKKCNLSDNSKEATGPKKPKKQHQAAVTMTIMFLKKAWTLQAAEVFFLIA